MFQRLLPIIALALPLTAQAWFFPVDKYPKPAGKYPLGNAADSAALRTKIQGAWSSYKSKFVQNGIVTDPSGFTPNGGKVSEGVGYGMLLSVLMNDSVTFRTIWFKAEQSFWFSKDNQYGWYAWQGNDKMVQNDQYAATDADEDVALALIFASALARIGYWPNYTYVGNHKTLAGATFAVTRTVEQKALDVVTSINKYMIARGTGFPLSYYVLHSSAAFAQTDATGKAIMLQNPSYFAPGWYRVFQDFMATRGEVYTNNWPDVIANGYSVARAQPNGTKGMSRDWSTETGAYVKLSWMNTSLFGHVGDMWYDAIRVPYRLGMDAYWFQDAQAGTWVKGVWDGGIVSASSPRMFTNLDASPSGQLPGLEQTPRAMWAVSAMGGKAVGHAASSTAATTFSADIISKPWGGTNQYFDESLALLGALVVSGNFPNVWRDLKASFPDTSAKLTQPLAMTPASPIAMLQDVTFTAALDKPVACTLTIKGQTSGTTFQWIGSNTKTVSVVWNSSKRKAFSTTVFGNEKVTATFRWTGTVPADAKNSVTFDLSDPSSVARRPVAFREGLVSMNPQGLVELRHSEISAGSVIGLRLLDASGRIVTSARVAGGAEFLHWQAPALQSGLYFVEADLPSKTLRQPLAVIR